MCMVACSLQHQTCVCGVQAQFIDVCILCGCDYCGSIKGIGPKKALKMIAEHGTLEKALEHLDAEKYPLPNPFPIEVCLFTGCFSELVAFKTDTSTPRTPERRSHGAFAVSDDALLAMRCNHGFSMQQKATCVRRCSIGTMLINAE